MLLILICLYYKIKVYLDFIVYYFISTLKFNKISCNTAITTDLAVLLNRCFPTPFIKIFLYIYFSLIKNIFVLTVLFKKKTIKLVL